ncbi:MAG TPA: class I SAM-dependent methyltransferase [candidate division Zixibacteria bacterium]|nr:class I SAM-dependent methyltransferase [candidate division Zixibacteria bacterium]
MPRTSDKEHWDALWQKRDVKELYDNSGRILTAVRRLFGDDLAGKRILEVGAGSARDSFDLAGLGAEVWTLDYSHASLEIIQQQNEQSEHKTIPIGGDAFALPFADESFDLVFHQGLIEHFREEEGIIAENARVTKPGGYVIVDVPQRWHIYTVIKHALIAINMWFAGWEKEFSLRQVEAKLRKFGLEPVDFYAEWMYPCLFYRMTREALWKLGVRLPLVPFKIPGLHQLRRAIRNRLKYSRFFAYTGISVGVVGKKPEA